MDFAQIKAGKFRKNISNFNILSIVKDVMMIQQRKALDNNIEQQIHFVNIRDEEGSNKRHSPIIRTDKQRVMQVLLGLQSNALKFTKDGKVEIIVEIVT